MQGNDPRDFAYPNIIFKKKLTPIPLFNQNLSPKCASTPKKANSWFTPRNPNLMISPQTMKGSQTQSFLYESKTVNNYGRLCDQPFLEYSNFHSSQLLGSGAGKKIHRLDPIEWKYERKRIAFNRKNKSVQSTPTLPQAKHSPITITVEEKSPKYQAPQVIEADEEDDDNVGRIEGLFRYIDHEVTMTFASLDVIIFGFASKPVTINVGKNDLKKIYKQPVNQMAQLICSSVVYKNGKLKVKLTGAKSPTKASDRFADHQTYPEEKEDLAVTINGQPYRALITFPYLEASIDALNYREKFILNPGYLTNLFDHEFENMEEYIEKFNIPSRSQPTPDELLIEELKALPTTIKKVIKTDEFGGLMIFKTMEIHLKSTSESEPQITVISDEEVPSSKARKRRAKDNSNVILRLSVYELSQVLKCNIKELIHLLQDSIKFEEGKGPVIELDSELLRDLGFRSDVMHGNYPASVDKFAVRVNNVQYEAEIKFPTLELYVPETSYRDVIQLTPIQLEDLMENAFKNMEDYMQHLKSPSEQQEYRSSISPEPKIRITEAKEEERSKSKIESPRTVQSELLDERSKKNSMVPPEERSNAEELKALPNIIKKVIKTDDFGGLLLFKNLEVVLKNNNPVAETETTEEDQPSSKKKRKPRDPVINAKISVYQLSQILKCSVKESVDLIRNSLKSEDGKTFSIEFDAMKMKLYNSRKESQLSPASDASEKFQVNAGNASYEGFIRFPTLELYVPETGFRDVIVLDAAQLDGLVESSFENLEDYLQFLKSPPASVRTEYKEEISQGKDLKSLKSSEELLALPNFLKKVIKTDEFGGLLIFKNLEISLKNISTNATSESVPTEGDNPSDKKKVRKPREPNLIAKTSVLQMSQLLNCNIEELINVIKDSIKSEDGKNFTVELDSSVVEKYAGRSEALFNPTGEVSEKFEVTVNGTLYEAFIRFPTLELYVPESSFRDVIHLNATQLNDLIANSFENVEDYLNSLKKPSPSPSQREE